MQLLLSSVKFKNTIYLLLKENGLCKAALAQLGEVRLEQPTFKVSHTDPHLLASD